MVHCVTYVLLLLAAVCLVRTMKVITFSFCVRRCTSCERCVCCSVNGKQETCLSWNVHGNQEELLYYSVDGNWEAWLLTGIRKCNCTLDLTVIWKCYCTEVLMGISMAVLQWWGELRVVAVLKFSTAVRKCACTGVLKEIRKRTSNVDWIG
jgi:hypothetical protein